MHLCMSVCNETTHALHDTDTMPHQLNVALRSSLVGAAPTTRKFLAGGLRDEHAASRVTRSLAAQRERALTIGSRQRSSRGTYRRNKPKTKSFFGRIFGGGGSKS